MPTELGALVVIATVPDQNVGVKIAEEILSLRLAACVHMLPAGRSIYRWQGRIEDTAEILLIIKTTSRRYAELEASIVRLHPFEVPEVIAFPATQVLPQYLDWLLRETA
jgi:periplasmic divalent cation tolerance protein